MATTETINKCMGSKTFPSKYFLLKTRNFCEYIEVINKLTNSSSSISTMNCNTIRYDFNSKGEKRIEFCKNIKITRDEEDLINITFYEYQKRYKEIIDFLNKGIQ